jgi:hypothetical protein
VLLRQFQIVRAGEDLGDDLPVFLLLQRAGGIDARAPGGYQLHAQQQQAFLVGGALFFGVLYVLSPFSLEQLLRLWSYAYASPGAILVLLAGLSPGAICPHT